MRRLGPVLALFFLAPLVAEFFLGDFPITLLPLLVVFAPMYGGAAVLIREVTRRTGRGRATMLLLALAYGVLEEGLVTQSLFDPNFLNAHLLDDGFVPALGTAIPWLVFVLSLHTFWSVNVPVAIVEEAVPSRRTTPWLGRGGLTVVSVLFGLGTVAMFAQSQQISHGFMATPAQLGVSAGTVVLLIVAAFLVPSTSAKRAGTVPNGWVLLGVGIAGGLLFMSGLALPALPGIAAMLLAPALVGVLVARWAARDGWGQWQRLGLTAGTLLTYSWVAFRMHTSSVVIDLISHVLYAVAALAILYFTARRIRTAGEASVVPTIDSTDSAQPALSAA